MRGINAASEMGSGARLVESALDDTLRHGLHNALYMSWSGRGWAITEGHIVSKKIALCPSTCFVQHVCGFMARLSMKQLPGALSQRQDHGRGETRVCVVTAERAARRSNSYVDRHLHRFALIAAGGRFCNGLVAGRPAASSQCPGLQHPAVPASRAHGSVP